MQPPSFSLGHQWPVRGYSNGVNGAGNTVPRLADPATLHGISGRTMGTTWSVRLSNPHMLALDDLKATVEAALATVVQQMSPWEPDSHITRFNTAPAGSWHSLPDEFLRVMLCSLDHARDSGGAFDPTLGALVDAWGFGPRANQNANGNSNGNEAWSRDTPPDSTALAAARLLCGWHRIELDTAGRRLRQPGGLRLDLSGIAKGFAVDLVAEALATHGITDCLVEVGGELLARGKRSDGQHWRVAVARPDLPHERQTALTLHDMAIATSGDAWHAFEHAGRRYSHTIDPRTGEPVAHARSLASVTVLHLECMQADALATALTVLGVEEGFAFAESRDVAALFIERKSGGALLPLQTRAFERLAA